MSTKEITIANTDKAVEILLNWRDEEVAKLDKLSAELADPQNLNGATLLRKTEKLQRITNTLLYIDFMFDAFERFEFLTGLISWMATNPHINEDTGILNRIVINSLMEEADL